MDFVTDSQSTGLRIEHLKVADDFSHECVSISVDCRITGRLSRPKDTEVYRHECAPGTSQRWHGVTPFGRHVNTAQILIDDGGVNP